MFYKTDARRSASVFFLQSALEISFLVLYNGKQREYVYTKKLTDGVRLYEQYYHDGIEQRTG